MESRWDMFFDSFKKMYPHTKQVAVSKDVYDEFTEIAKQRKLPSLFGLMGVEVILDTRLLDEKLVCVPRGMSPARAVAEYMENEAAQIEREKELDELGVPHASRDNKFHAAMLMLGESGWRDSELRYREDGACDFEAVVLDSNETHLLLQQCHVDVKGRMRKLVVDNDHKPRWVEKAVLENPRVRLLGDVGFTDDDDDADEKEDEMCEALAKQCGIDEHQGVHGNPPKGTVIIFDSSDAFEWRWLDKMAQFDPEFRRSVMESVGITEKTFAEELDAYGVIVFPEELEEDMMDEYGDDDFGDDDD